MARRSRTLATRTAARRPRSISLLFATVLVALVAAILLASSSSTGPSAVSALPQPADDNSNKDNNNKDKKKDEASPTPAPSSASSSAPSPTASNSAKPSATGSATGSATPTATNSGNSTSKPATTTVNKPGSNTDLTPTLKPDDPCEDGVCDIKNRGTCLMLEKTGVCKAFSGMYLPLNLRDYFDAKFPLKKPETIPDNIGNATTFDNLFSMGNYGYFGKYAKQYMLLEAACDPSNQRWFRTWVCIQMIQWYAAKGNPCSTGLAPKICGSTLDDRANSIEGDLKNKTICSGTSNPVILDIGMKYVQSIRTLPWRSASAADTSCIAGPNNEADGAAKYCGYSQYAVCDSGFALCPTAPITPEECKDLLDRKKAKLKAQSTSGILDSNDRDGHKSTYYVMGGLGVAALFALGSGLYALANIRLVGAKTGEAAHAAAPAKPEPAPGASTAKAAPALTPSASIQMKPMPSPAVAPAAVAGMPMAAAAAAAPGGGERVIEQVQVASPFQASQGDELNLFPGQTVGVYQRFDDGWARGVNMATGQVGFFPYSVCHPQQGPMGARFQSLGRR